ncbi:Acetyltransferase [compost metagenome]
MELSFSPQAILDLLTRRQVLVATSDRHIVATASLDRDVVRSVFVDPIYQGRGIGRELMARIQSIAIKDGITLLRVPSSITAEGFYASLGFKKFETNFTNPSALSSWRNHWCTNLLRVLKMQFWVDDCSR